MKSLVSEIVEPSALESLERAQVDVQITTAKRYPRSITTFKRECLELATSDEETASSCYYRMRRGGNLIEGPSVRLAEFVASAWGNIQCASRVVEIGPEFVTSQGVAFDMERNVRVSVETKRRITDKEGKRYTEDMIAVTANAASSIALRNAIFRVVPQSLIRPIYNEAKKVSIGEGKDMGERRRRLFGFYEQRGAKAQDILAALGRKGMDDVSIEDLITLKGMANAIADGELSLAEALRPKGDATDRRATTSDLNEELEAMGPAQEKA